MKTAEEYAQEAANLYEQTFDPEGCGTVHGVAATAQQAIAAAMLAELALKLNTQVNR